MKLNDRQLQAVETIDRNVALVAGAGTGKTGVLTRRFLRILEQGNLPPGRELRSVVAITFTEKAAAEMQSRIRKQLQERPDLLQQLDGQTELRISTIHGFCAQILREDPAGAGVDPQFSILEQADAAALLREAVRESYAKLADEVPEALLIRHGWFAHGDFFDQVLALDRQLRAAAVELTEVRTESLKVEAITETLDTRLREAILATLPRLTRATRLVKFLQDDSLRRKLDGPIEVRDALYRRMKEEEVLSGTQTGELKTLLTEYLAERESEFSDSYDFLFTLLKEARRVYAQKKTRASVLDFDDLQELALQRLEDPDSGAKIRNEIRYLMIDESQDINELQAQIFYRICSEKTRLDRRNLFVVGDPRQSIYGFRHARAELFDRLQEEIRASGGAVISMQTNYRCSRQIIDYVNGVFRIHFPGLDELVAGGSAKSVCIERCAPAEGEDGGPEADADRVVNKVLELFRSGVRWDEIALLFRASTRMHLYEDRLKAAGIPCVNLSSRSLWNRQEVQDLLAGVRVITETADDSAWLAFLRSPLAALSDREILRLKAAGDEWEERLTAGKYEMPAARKTLDFIREAREFLRFSPLPALVERIRRTYDVFCAGEPDAERRLANLDRLSEWIATQWRTLNLSPAELADLWLSRSGIEGEEGELTRSVDGRVELMTIHKAKGVEKRVVFLVGIDAKSSSAADAFLYDTGRVHIRGTARHELASQRKKERERTEELRILYVALTRAVESLYLTSQTGKNQHFHEMLAAAGFDPAALPAMTVQPQSIFTHSAHADSAVPERKRTPDRCRQMRPYSASQLMTFRRCKRAWYLRYDLGLPEQLAERPAIDTQGRPEVPEESLSGAAKGSLFHRLAERDDGSDCARLIEEAAKEAKVHLLPEEEIQLTNWLGFLRAHRFTGPVRHELTFDWERAGVRWTGSIDVAEAGDPPRIYDFKTNRDKPDFEADYALQMQFYALAYRALTGVVPEAVLWWMPENLQVFTDVSPEALSRLEAEMDAFTEYLQHHTLPAAYPCAPDCTNSCALAGVCRLLP